MSIFITLLAFDDGTLIDGSKIAIILGSVLSGIFGYFGLRLALKQGTSGIDNAHEEKI
jgi:NhaA family Na+:H+ antiporter